MRCDAAIFRDISKTTNQHGRQAVSVENEWVTQFSSLSVLLEDRYKKNVNTNYNNNNFYNCKNKNVTKSESEVQSRKGEVLCELFGEDGGSGDQWNTWSALHLSSLSEQQLLTVLQVSHRPLLL